MPVTIDEQPLATKPDLVLDNFDEMLGGERLAYSSSDSENDDTSGVPAANSGLTAGLDDKRETSPLKQNGSSVSADLTNSSPISQVDVLNDLKETSSELDNVLNGYPIPINGVDSAIGNELSEDLLLNDSDDESDIGLLKYSDVDEDKLLADIPFNDENKKSDNENFIEKETIGEPTKVVAADVGETKELISTCSNVDGMFLIIFIVFEVECL